MFTPHTLKVFDTFYKAQDYATKHYSGFVTRRIVEVQSNVFAIQAAPGLNRWVQKNGEVE